MQQNDRTHGLGESGGLIGELEGRLEMRAPRWHVAEMLCAVSAPPLCSSSAVLPFRCSALLPFRCSYLPCLFARREIPEIFQWNNAHAHFIIYDLTV